MNRAWKVDAAGVGVLGLLTGAGYLAGLGPFLGARVAKARHDIALSEAREDRDGQLRKAVELHRRLEERQEEVRSLNVELRSASSKYGQTSAIAALAQESGLSISQVNPEAARAVMGVPSVVVVPVVLQGTGTYSQVGEFMHAIFNNHRDTAVDRFHLRAEPGSAGGVATFSVRLYWFAQPEGAE